MAYGLPDYPRARADGGFGGTSGGTGWGGVGRGGGSNPLQGLLGLFSQIYGKLGTEQTAHRDWIKELMGLTRSTMADTTAGLARGLGSHMSRTNVPIPAGADIMARRHLSPMTQTLEAQLAQLQAMLQQPQSRLGMATGLTQQMAPLFRGRRGLPDLSQYWGGGS